VGSCLRWALEFGCGEGERGGFDDAHGLPDEARELSHVGAASSIGNAETAMGVRGVNASDGVVAGALFGCSGTKDLSSTNAGGAPGYDLEPASDEDERKRRPDRKSSPKPERWPPPLTSEARNEGGSSPCNRSVTRHARHDFDGAVRRCGPGVLVRTRKVYGTRRSARDGEPFIDTQRNAERVAELSHLEAALSGMRPPARCHHARELAVLDWRHGCWGW
jgi:hypothetical protein